MQALKIYVHRIIDLKHTEILAVVVSFNGLSKTQHTINALRNKVGHIHVVDNASGVMSLSMIDVFKDETDISFTRLNENKGVGYALNVGVKIAKELGYSWLLTMDQDSIADKLMIESYCRVIDRNSELVSLSPNLVINGKSSKKRSGAVKYSITSGNLVKMSLFDEIGLYDERLFIDCIDFDFSLRIRQAGYKIYHVHDAILQHEHGDANVIHNCFSRYYASHPPLRRYYMFRNHMYLLEKYAYKFPFFIIKSTVANLLLLVLIPIFDKNPIRGLLYAFRGICDYLKGRNGIYI